MLFVKMREALISQSEITDVYQECPVQRRIINNTPISSVLNSSDKCISVELCPGPGRKLHLDSLPNLNLNFCSITWHSPSEHQLKNVEEIPAIKLAMRLGCQGYNVLLHLAGRNLSRNQVLDILNVVKKIGVKNIFALQGDPSQIREHDDEKCDFPYAADLVRFIRLHFGNYFCIGVAGYPDVHPRSKNLNEDTHYLKEKVSSGADFIITQASYDYESFNNFIKICRESDIHIPIIPGIFIITSYKTLIGMSKFCAVPISPKVHNIVYKNKSNTETVKAFGIYHATEIMKQILANSEWAFGGIHIFSLNDFELVKDVLSRLCLLKARLEYPL